MPTLTIIGRDGAETTITAEPGLSVMEAIRKAGYGELQAMCGGCCSCATCHVYVEQGLEAFAAVSEDEDDLLDGSDHRQGTSRLSCQLALTGLQSSIRVVIAPED